MNDNHSNNELFYHKRLIATNIKEAIKTFPVVVISGARQVGKSTLLRNEFPGFKYLTLDDYATLEQADKDPESLWIGNNKTIIDEAQKSPKLFNAIKLTVDKTNRNIRFILSGSSNLLLMKKLTETLAGRAIYLELSPMLYSEMKPEHKNISNFLKLWEPNSFIKENKLTSINTLMFLLKGFMPPLLNVKKPKDILLWWESYIMTYLERDLREFSRIDSLIDFRKVMSSIAIRSGNILNQSDISRTTGISQPTIHRYIKLLEISNMLKSLPAYSYGRLKRLAKGSKFYFTDPALSVFLSGYHDDQSLNQARELGSFFETLVFLHLQTLSELLVPKGKLFYWRRSDGKEVDFVIEHGQKLLAFESKLTKKPSYSDISNLLTFIEQYPETIRGILIHTGHEIKWLHQKVIAVPWWWLSE